jgi:hypothetical protein
MNGSPAIGNLINIGLESYVLPALFTLAVVVFLWGAFQYRLRAFDEHAKEEGKALMFYGLLAFSLMIVIWGFARIAGNALSA